MSAPVEDRRPRDVGALGRGHRAAHVVEHPTHPGVPRATERDGSPWPPYSPCGPDCLPPGARPARLRAARRTVALLAVIAAAVATLPLVALFGRRATDRAMRRTSRAALRAAGVELRVTGGERFADDGGVLVVANHLSWIDVLALGAVQPVRMIAKREVGDWPVVGRIAARSGALFVDRAGLRSLPAVVDDTADALRAGSAVGVFPEGTTWCGSAAGPFRRAPFQAAVDAGVPVRPVTLELRLADGRPTTAASFVGDETLADSLRRVLALDGLVCELTLHPLLRPGPGEDRRVLAARARRVVTGAALRRAASVETEPAAA
ncbi:1-acyl-sn-glycerol-3-phosphate acyltransferase [Pseudonocardia sp. N23]|uniref:lysophospholipid acyltransferase family protein n=1 Tax=Pseudonocardia sp. N23 TaxID=1987376 RepID=UPI000BFE6266|nr:lysophospholipid acyltransferase family protein [Pseudonocardia sp. N23]GAY12317.1 1-acyl-sn-glycerol-3-phosphate acyltransferase [Pseudonocardia sp. N23]